MGPLFTFGNIIYSCSRRHWLRGVVRLLPAFHYGRWQIRNNAKFSTSGQKKYYICNISKPDIVVNKPAHSQFPINFFTNWQETRSWAILNRLKGGVILYLCCTILKHSIIHGTLDLHSWRCYQQVYPISPETFAATDLQTVCRDGSGWYSCTCLSVSFD